MTSLAFVLRLNAASCLGFGVLFVALPGEVALTLGAAPPGVVFGLGLVLLVNGGHLALASLRSRPIEAEILWFSLSDMAWWLASLALIAAGVWITTPLGVALALLVGACVAALGSAQLFLLGRKRSGLSASAHWLRIGRSWMALPAWVKAWLIALNAVFLAAPALMPWDAARVVLIAYVASGPLLLGFAVHAGGLTRFMGIGHIVPWAPLLAWLMMQPDLYSEGFLRSGYASLLAVMIALCLAFDLYDVIRWHRGERAILMRSREFG